VIDIWANSPQFKSRNRAVNTKTFFIVWRVEIYESQVNI